MKVAGRKSGKKKVIKKSKGSPKKPSKKVKAKKTLRREILVPVINIGTVGQIDHGKTTLTKCITGRWADVHSEEIKRGMTIRLGYADITFRKCPKCKSPACYTTLKKCMSCGKDTEVLRTASFVDAPGHEALMSTMLSGAGIMDGAIIVIAANEKCPQPQTREHLTALKILGVKNLIVVQNKVDLVPEAQVEKNYKEIRKVMTDYGFPDDIPIIPASAQHGINTDVVLEAVDKFLPTPKRDGSKDPLMFIARSFDINKPGEDISKLRGGVLGGSIKQGRLKLGDEIEIRPGIKVTEANQTRWQPLTTRISSIFTGGTSAKEANPGGSVGIGTSLDPSLAKSDALSGSVAGRVGKLPPLLNKLLIETHLLKNVVGSEETSSVEPIKMNEPLLLNVNAGITSGIVTSARPDSAEIVLKIPACVNKGDRIAISRRLGQRWRLIGYGIIS